MIDIWMCLHVALLFLIFLVHMIVNIAKERYDERIEQERDNIAERKWATMKSILDLVSDYLSYNLTYLFSQLLTVCFLKTLNLTIIFFIIIMITIFRKILLSRARPMLGERS